MKFIKIKQINDATAYINVNNIVAVIEWKGREDHSRIVTSNSQHWVNIPLEEVMKMIRLESDKTKKEK